MLKVIGTTVENFVFWATRHPGFEHPYLIQPYIYNNDPFFLQGLCCMYCHSQFVIACRSLSVVSCISYDFA